MKLEDLVGAKSGDREHFKDAFRHFLAQLFKTWMRSGLVELGDDICDSVADTGISVSVPAAIIRSKGCERAARLSAALR